MNQTASQYAPGIELKREEVTAADLVNAGVDLARDFPGAPLSEFKRYPVLSEGGWYMVIKHLPTLRSVSRVPWNLLGPVPLTSNGLVLE
jgi:hypothetical protein